LEDLQHIAAQGGILLKTWLASRSGLIFGATSGKYIHIGYI
jgi:hypothetical protein